MKKLILFMAFLISSTPAFAIYDFGTVKDPSDDVVLDKETGLVWERVPLAPSIYQTPPTWSESQAYCNALVKGGRIGWRLPTLQELSSLVDPRIGTDPLLPSGHPFMLFTRGGFTSTS
jgi:hypothetical protein